MAMLEASGTEGIERAFRREAVARFQPDSENVTVGSERTWLVTLQLERQRGPRPPAETTAARISAAGRASACACFPCPAGISTGLAPL